MSLPLRCLPFLLVTSACVLPSAPEGESDELVLEEQAAALLASRGALQQAASGSGRLTRPGDFLEEPPAPRPDPDLLRTQCGEPGWTYAYFIQPQSGDCTATAGTSSGVWQGSLALPGVVEGLCRYQWFGNGVPDENALRSLAEAFEMTSDCRTQLSSCPSVADCPAAVPVSAEERVSVKLPVPDEPGPGTSPCPACKGVLVNRKLIAVLPADATEVVAFVREPGVESHFVVRSAGQQVVSIEVGEHFPVSNSTNIEFR